MTPPDTLLVIPTCRDGVRLAGFLPDLCAQLAFGLDGVLVQVVDDGSPQGEQLWLAAEIDRLRRAYDFLQPLISLPVNRGKGYAIRTGWAAHASMRWLAFVDADGAAPAADVVVFLERARKVASPSMVIAVRTDLPGTTVTRFWHRRLGSRMFNAWVRFCLGLELSDTQCGLKAIPASFHTQSKWQENGFAFDLELLLRARAVKLPVLTQPINWSEHAGSSLGSGAMLGLFVAVWRLRAGMTVRS